METPVARTRVCLKDESGVFLVVWVDWDRRRVDLLRVSNGDSHPLMEGVAFNESIVSSRSPHPRKEWPIR